MNNIILIGMPGSGKTTVCSLCSKKYNLPVYDTDKYIEQNHGVISDIFKEYGEEYFRELETQALKELCRIDGSIISTGGGCVLREENVKVMRENGLILYLKAKLSTLEARLKGDTSRPLLQGGSEKLRQLYLEREQKYSSLSDRTTQVDDLTPDELAEYVYNAFNQLKGKR